MTSQKNTHRKLLNLSVVSICKDAGFEKATNGSLETLTELLQAHLAELTHSCRKFCEHSHRTTPDLTDCNMALAEVGSSAHALNIYCKRTSSKPPKQLNVAKPPSEHKCLKSGLPKVNQPTYIPTHFIEYPEVHSFVRTPSLREPINQYEMIRERVAKQNILTEESLVKFLSHTRPSEDVLFENVDRNLYPTIRLDQDPYPYLQGLLPSQKEHQSSDGNQSDDKLDTSNEEINSQNSLGSSGSSIDNAYLREPKRVRSKK